MYLLTYSASTRDRCFNYQILLATEIYYKAAVHLAKALNANSVLNENEYSWQYCTYILPSFCTGIKNKETWHVMQMKHLSLPCLQILASWWLTIYWLFEWMLERKATKLLMQTQYSVTTFCNSFIQPSVPKILCTIFAKVHLEGNKGTAGENSVGRYLVSEPAHHTQTFHEWQRLQSCLPRCSFLNPL